jgi:hypothetical protein
VRTVLLLSLIALSGCSEPSEAQPPAERVASAETVPAPAATPEPAPMPWPPEAVPHPAGPGVLAYDVSERLRHDGEKYLLHRFRLPLDRTRIDVVDARMGTGLDRLLRDRRAALVINGGFYSPRSEAEGLVIAGGRQINPFLARIKGGVVAVRRGPRAEHHAAEGLALPLPEDVEFAIQCSPQLVVRGQPAVERFVENTASRTALCIRDGGRGLDVYVARVDPSRGRAGPTLHTFSRELVAEGCEEALNLDGGPSTGVAWRAPGGERALLPRRGVRHAVVFTLADP